MATSCTSGMYVENDQACDKLPTSFQPEIANTNKLATWVGN